MCVQANSVRLNSQDYVVFCAATGLGKEADPQDVLRTINIFHHVFEALGLCCRNSEASPTGVLPMFYKFLAQRLKCVITAGQSNKQALDERALTGGWNTRASTAGTRDGTDWATKRSQENPTKFVYYEYVLTRD